MLKSIHNKLDLEFEDFYEIDQKGNVLSGKCTKNR